MLKNHKTGNSIPLFMVNVLPRLNFDKIYKVKEIHYISITKEAFKGSKKTKHDARASAMHLKSAISHLNA